VLDEVVGFEVPIHHEANANAGRISLLAGFGQEDQIPVERLRRRSLMNSMYRRQDRFPGR
jgi:hypothetical protein